MTDLDVLSELLNSSPRVRRTVKAYIVKAYQRGVKAGEKQGRAAVQREFDSLLDRIDTVSHLNGTTAIFKAEWEESKHPRGQPGNAGQFGPGGGTADQPALSDMELQDHRDQLVSAAKAKIRQTGLKGYLKRYVIDTVLGNDEAVKQIPRGSKFLGAGTEAIAFKTPEGDVVRLEPNRGPRPDIPEILQPTATAVIGDGDKAIRIERLPFAKKISPADAAKAIPDLHEKLAARGYDWTDDKTANVGIVDGEIKIIDPGNITKRGGSSMKFAKAWRAETKHSRMKVQKADSPPDDADDSDDDTDSTPHLSTAAEIDKAVCEYFTANARPLPVPVEKKEEPAPEPEKQPEAEVVAEAAPEPVAEIETKAMPVEETVPEIELPADAEMVEREKSVFHVSELTGASEWTEENWGQAAHPGATETK